MTDSKMERIMWLWGSGKASTLDIARAVKLSEAEVYNALSRRVKAKVAA